MSVLWSLRDVTLVSENTERLRSTSVEISDGVTAVLGYSGAGKTSLLNVLVEFERPTSGSIERRLPDSSVPLFWVPQNGGLWNHVSAREHIQLVTNGAKNGAAGARSEAGSTNTDQWLEQFDLEPRAASRPAELSQGERARLAVARALATNASVLVMDEPLAHVDAGRVRRYFDAIADHVLAGSRSLLFATHQPELVLRYAKQVICLDAGNCVFSGLVTDLYENPPDSRLATLLGPGNWISTDEFGFWLDHNERAEGMLRPERLRIEQLETPEANSGRRFVVVKSERLGPTTETLVREESTDRQRSFVHLTVGVLSGGQSVRLSVLGEDGGTANE